MAEVDRSGSASIDVTIVDLGLEPLPRSDCAVVIDVIRAFTTAAFAFEYGASSITCVASIGRANHLRAAGAVDLLMGEERGQLIEGFR